MRPKSNAEQIGGAISPRAKATSKPRRRSKSVGDVLAPTKKAKKHPEGDATATAATPTGRRLHNATRQLERDVEEGEFRGALFKRGDRFEGECSRCGHVVKSGRMLRAEQLLRSHLVSHTMSSRERISSG